MKIDHTWSTPQLDSRMRRGRNQENKPMKIVKNDVVAVQDIKLI